MSPAYEAARKTEDIAREGWQAARDHREAVMTAWEAVNTLRESARAAEDAAWHALTESWAERERASRGPAELRTEDEQEGQAA